VELLKKMSMTGMKGFSEGETAQEAHHGRDEGLFSEWNDAKRSS
jgi:hypothetical protein